MLAFVNYTAAQIEMAEGHVSQGERHIIQQEELISRLRSRGLSTKSAEELLQMFRDSLRSHREHLDRMLKSPSSED